MENIIRIEGAGRMDEGRGRRRLAFAGLFAFTLLLYARPSEAFPETFGDFSIIKLVAIGTLLAYTLSTLARGGSLTVMPIEFKMLLVITFLGIAFIPVAATPGDSINLLMDLFLKVVTIFMLMINLIDTRARLLTMMKLVTIAGTVLGLFAIASYVEGKFAVQSSHVGVRIAGVVGGIFENPNDLATSLVLLIPMAAALALNRTGIPRFFYYACCGVLAIGVVTTFSRGGFLGLVAMGAWLLWKLSRGRRFVGALAFAATITVFLAAMPLGYSSRLSSIFDKESDPTGSSEARIELLQRSSAIALRHLFIGVGMGNFHIYSIHEQRAHNSYLEIAAELGIAGLIAYLIMLFAPLRSLRRIEADRVDKRKKGLDRLGPPERRGTYYLAVALQASLIGYIVCSFFGSIQYLWFLYYPLAYAVALKQIAKAESESEVHDKSIEGDSGDSIASGVLWRSREQAAAPGRA